MTAELEIQDMKIRLISMESVLQILRAFAGTPVSHKTSALPFFSHLL